jgi:NDP-sugar pyrophosphorylase family protein
MAEYQGIILSLSNYSNFDNKISGDESERLSPINKTISKPLLPILNKPMLHYSISYFEKNYLKDIIIVVQKKDSKEIKKFLKTFYKEKFHYETEDTINTENLLEVKDDTKVQKLIQLEIVDDNLDSVSALKQIKAKITKNFILMNVDLITNVPLIKLLTIHRNIESGIVFLLSEEKTDKKNKDSKSLKESDRYAYKNYIGFETKESNRVVLLSSNGKIDKHIKLKQKFLQKCSNFSISNKFEDCNLYVCSYWVLDFICNSEMNSFSNEVMSYLVKKQYKKFLDYGFHKIICYKTPNENYSKRAYTVPLYLSINKEINSFDEFKVEQEQISENIGKDCLIGMK